MFLVIHVVEAFVRRVVGLSVMRHGSLASAVACWTVLEGTDKLRRNFEFSDVARKIKTVAEEGFTALKNQTISYKIHAEFITFNVCLII